MVILPKHIYDLNLGRYLWLLCRGLIEVREGVIKPLKEGLQVMNRRCYAPTKIYAPKREKILEVTNEHNTHVWLCSINKHTNAVLLEKVELSSDSQVQ